jgi:hypothetical protein
MMKHTIKLYLLFCFYCSVSFAQNDSSKTALYDFSPKLSLHSWQNNFEFSIQPNLFIDQMNDSSSIMMRTRLQLSGIYKLNGEDPIKNNLKTNLLNPLYQEFASTQSMKELKYILGMVQVGGVAYLAYQHIKKYGFLKKK